LLLIALSGIEARSAIIGGMESSVLHVSEADLANNLTSIIQKVESGVEVIIERDARPVAVIRAIAPLIRNISECIALAKTHEEETGQTPTLDPDFAADVEEIVRSRQLWNPPSWD
jgi:antitoxin (DNA-binding transcriptional repressor) of toxin-antitoxin stability system